MNNRYCPQCGQWPTHKAGCSQNTRPRFVGQERGKIKRLEDDIKRLTAHCAVMYNDLANYAENADWSTESFINLPDHLQTAISIEGEKIAKHGI